MKKMWAVVAMVAVLMSSMTAVAANPSATGSLVEVVTEMYEGVEVTGYIVADDGTILQGVALDAEDIWIKVTDVSVAAEELSEESIVKLETATTQLEEVTAVTDVIDVADIPEDFDHENAVVSSIFDIDVSDEIKAVLAANPGATVQVMINIDVAADTGILVLHNYTDDLWEVLQSENNGDGTAKIWMGANGFSPVAVYIDTVAEANADTEISDDVDVSDDAEVDTTVDAGTESNSTTMMLVAVAVIAILAAIFIIIAKKRKKEDEEEKKES